MDLTTIDPRNPALAKAGWLAAQLYRHLIFLSEKYKLDGRFDDKTVTLEWIAREWNLTDGEFQRPAWGVVQSGVVDLLCVGLLSHDNGVYEIKDIKPKKAKLDRQANPPAKQDDSLTATAVAKLWNEHADKSLARVISVEGQRLTFTTARAKEYSAEQLIKAIKSINESPGLLGKAKGNGSYGGWKASFDWFVRAGTIPKLLEGKYAQWGKQASSSVTVKAGEQMYHDDE